MCTIKYRTVIIYMVMSTFIIGCSKNDNSFSEANAGTSYASEENGTRSGKIEGKIFFEDNQSPLHGIHVQLYTIQEMKDSGLESVSFHKEADQSPTATMETVTDSQGNYSFDNVKPGEHLLVCSPINSNAGAEIVQVLVLDNQSSTIDFKAVKKQVQQYNDGRFVVSDDTVLVAMESLALQ